MSVIFLLRVSRRSTVATLFTFLFAIGALSDPARADMAGVSAGWDLFATDSNGTSLPGLGQMEGVPLGTFNFGGAIGVENAQNTDTIIERLAAATPASVPGSATINIQVDALQLKTVDSVNFNGDGNASYYLTLQSTHGGMESTGTLTINFTNATSGTFTSTLDLFYDIRMGSLTGPIVSSSDIMLSSMGTPWANLPPPNATTLTGVNVNLNGIDNSNDFWPNGDTPESAASRAKWQEFLKNAARTPEPSSWVLWFALAGLAAVGRRRQLIAVRGARP